MGYRISDDYKKPALQQLQHFAELSELREKDSLDTFFFLILVQKLNLVGENQLEGQWTVLIGSTCLRCYTMSNSNRCISCMAGMRGRGFHKTQKLIAVDFFGPSQSIHSFLLSS